jgi:hypothetical protein
MNSALLRSARNAIYFRKPNLRTGRAAFMSTHSGDDAKRPEAVAMLHLEDGTTLVGKSFGCHTSVEGEVSIDESKRIIPGRRL